MADVGATSVVVDLGDGTLGIITDRDLRSRVVARASTRRAGPEAMSAPAYTVTADRLGGEVLLDMLDRGIRHFPVVSPTGPVDRRGRGLRPRRRRYAQLVPSALGDRARDDPGRAVAAAAAGLRPAVVALHDARVAATDISAIQSVVDRRG